MERIPELKVIIIGDAGVGKTSLIYRLVINKFDPARMSALGFDYLTKRIAIQEQIYQLMLWDTAGSERTAVPLHRIYYRNPSCIVLVFSVDNRDSFFNLDKWYKECVQYSLVDIENVPFVLLGNKTDLETVVTPDEVKTWCDKHHNIPYVETSAKNGSGVQEGFELVTKRYHEQKQGKALKTIKLNHTTSSRSYKC